MTYILGILLGLSNLIAWLIIIIYCKRGLFMNYKVIDDVYGEIVEFKSKKKARSYILEKMKEHIKNIDNKHMVVLEQLDDLTIIRVEEIKEDDLQRA